MAKLKNVFFILFIILLSLLIGIFWGKRMELFKTHESESAQVMLEKVSHVFKLIAVEAEVSEIYDYKAYKYWDIVPFRKKAMVRVMAKGSIGYDFEKVEFVIDEKDRTITIESFPEPEILSVEHEIDYYDLNEGWFNSFSNEDLNSLNQSAKAHAVEIMKSSQIFEEADKQKTEIIKMLSSLFELSGWQLKTRNDNLILKN